tara:strand:+ start:311 stop:595 length:285 start_codon:yes stop_codon:yes gene_type:complete
MNIKNLNVFRRLDELETDNLYLRTMLKNVRMEVEALRGAVGDTVGILENMIRPKPKAKPGPKPKPKVVKASEKRREYARKYYAKKKAEKLAVTA